MLRWNRGTSKEIYLNFIALQEQYYYIIETNSNFELGHSNLRSKKSLERKLIEWRRLEVAKLWFRGKDANYISAALKVDISVIRKDMTYIRQNSDNIMRNYVKQTVPFILNKALSRLDQANDEAWKIIDSPNVHPRDRVSALGVVHKANIDMVNIITNNKVLVDEALEEEQEVLAESESEEGGQKEIELSSRSANQEAQSETEPIS